MDGPGSTLRPRLPRPRVSRSRALRDHAEHPNRHVAILRLKQGVGDPAIRGAHEPPAGDDPRVLPGARGRRPSRGPAAGPAGGRRARPADRGAERVGHRRVRSVRGTRRGAGQPRLLPGGCRARSDRVARTHLVLHAAAPSAGQPRRAPGTRGGRRRGPAGHPAGHGRDGDPRGLRPAAPPYPRVTAEVPRVAVLIVTRNRRRDLLESLDAVVALDHPPERLEVLVLDNGSQDGTMEAVKAWQIRTGGRLGRLECVRSPENLGAAAARNRLAAQASTSSDLFFVLDDDALPEPAFLKRMIAVFAGDPAIGVVGARIVAFDDPARDLAGAGFIDWRLGRFREKPASDRTDCDFVITCATVVRPAAFRAAGGFDEDYFVYHEDVDFCVRVARHGYRVCYEPAARARHKVPPGKTRAPERLYYLLRNKYLFLHKHLPPGRHPLPWLAYGAALVPRMLLQSLAINRGLAVRELRTILAAGCDGLRGRTGRWR